ncbi:hypothetical protein Hdeb2414_s0015g00450671 [Helianthus debilis subsp. tardiflorus]
MVDLRKVDFNAVVAVIPSCGEFYTRRKVVKDYEENLEKHIKKVLCASITKVIELKKKKEEVVKENVEKLVDELRKTTREADENQQNIDEKQKKTTDDTAVTDQKEVLQKTTECQHEERSLAREEADHCG